MAHLGLAGERLASGIAPCTTPHRQADSFQPPLPPAPRLPPATLMWSFDSRAGRSPHSHRDGHATSPGRPHPVPSYKHLFNLAAHMPARRSVRANRWGLWSRQYLWASPYALGPSRRAVPPRAALLLPGLEEGTGGSAGAAGPSRAPVRLAPGPRLVPASRKHPMTPTVVTDQAPIPPPSYHRAIANALHLDALTVVTRLHVLTLCDVAVQIAHRRCPPPLPAGPGGPPRGYREEPLLLIALLRTRLPVVLSRSP